VGNRWPLMLFGANRTVDDLPFVKTAVESGWRLIAGKNGEILCRSAGPAGMLNAGTIRPGATVMRCWGSNRVQKKKRKPDATEAKRFVSLATPRAPLPVFAEKAHTDWD